MDFEIPPVPLEAEFKISSIKHRLYQLSREELEELLVECISIMTKLTHQTRILKNHIAREQGKNT